MSQIPNAAMSYDPEKYDPNTDPQILEFKNDQTVRPTVRSVTPEPGLVFQAGIGCYYRPAEGQPIRRTTHKKMPKQMTARQIRKNVSRSKFIIQEDL